MNISLKIAMAIEEQDAQEALKLVQQAHPDDLPAIIAAAGIFDGAIANAVVSLAKSLLRIAKLEEELAEAKNAAAEAMTRLLQATPSTPPTPDDDTPSPF